MARYLTIDIGSTWTKGAIVDLDGSAPRLLARASVPTTQHDLAEGFTRVRGALERGEDGAPRAEGATVRFSSSAKGGLAIAAVGLVPDLTLNVARMAAASAGGKVTDGFSYRLASDHVAAIAATHPDIVLLCGGTDGGNKKVIAHNAAMLARSGPGVTNIIVAGNKSAYDQVAALLLLQEFLTEAGRSGRA